MKVPLSWLRELVEITVPVDELAHRLTMAGTEVEHIVVVGADWDQIFIAEVVALERHPNADNLLLARLDVGARGPATVVTGAPNLRVGARVPLVRPGGRLPGGREIQAETFRGITSEGMLCSGDELGLSPDRSGIYLLDGDGPAGGGPPYPPEFGGVGGATPGHALRDVLGETVLDLYITPNRPDCMSVVGVAREVHAITGARLLDDRVSGVGSRVPGIDLPPPTPDTRDPTPIVEIVDPDDCRRFTAARMTGVTVGPSPLWLQRRLHLAGVRPINNVVDATNYTMLELGQPQHAFDGDLLGDHIVVRRAGADERITTLDGVDRRLDGETLVIADGRQPVGIAGVMGGSRTEVNDATRTVVLETANFAPGSIRRTARELRLGSEASRRYERGLDPELAMPAARQTVRMLRELAGGTLNGSIVDVYPGRSDPRQIVVDEHQIGQLLGRAYSREQVLDVLQSLQFTIEPQGERVLVTVPGYRQDVEGRADLAEEVARITGYDAIPETLPTGAPPEPAIDPVRAAGDRAKDVLVSCGLQEVMTYSLVAPGSAARIANGAASMEEIPVANAISSEQSVLRVTLLPSLLETARANLRHRDGVALFELANVYLPPLAPLPGEQPRLGIILIGQATPTAWNAPRREADFFDLKGIVEELLANFGLAARYRPSAAAGYQPGRCAEALLGGGDAVSLGLFGQLHPRVAERFDLDDRRVYAAELRFDLLTQQARPQPQIRAVPRLPGLDRDLALIVDRSTAHADLEAALRATAGELLERITLFDTYEGPPIPPDKKSLAYTMRFRARDRTLTDDEADAEVARLVATAAGQFGAVLRSG